MNPPNPPTIALEETAKARVSRAEMALLDREAEKLGTNRSEILRRLIRSLDPNNA